MPITRLSDEREALMFAVYRSESILPQLVTLINPVEQSVLTRALRQENSHYAVRGIRWFDDFQLAVMRLNNLARHG